MQFRPLPLNMPLIPSLRNIWIVPCSSDSDSSRAQIRGRGYQRLQARSLASGAAVTINAQLRGVQLASVLKSTVF